MKQLFYFIFILYFTNSYAQTEKKFILRTNFGYNFSHQDNLDSRQSVDQYYPGGINTNKFNFGFTAGRKLKSNFYYGLGVFSTISKEETNPDVKFPEINGSLGFISLTSYMNTVSKNSSISPVIYFQYFTNFSEKFSIAFDLYSKYTFNSNSEAGTLYLPDIPNKQFIKSGNEIELESNQQFINVGICPSLRFNIYKNFGMELAFGKLQYSNKISDSRKEEIDNKTKEFEFGFKPENWLIGFYLNI